MYRVFVTLFLIFFSQVANSQTSPSFCSGSDLDMTPSSENCLTTCSAVANYSSAYLSAGESGYCIGQASYQRFNIYKLMLGKTSSGTNSLCTILDGTIPIIQPQNDGSSSGQDISFNLNNCPNDSYDVLHIIMSRYVAFSGNTVFPNALGTGSNPSRVRTTAPYSNSTSDYASISDWLETSTSHSDTSLEYVRPTGSWNTVYKKLGNTPLSSNLSSSTDVIMYYDELKGTSINDNGIYSGWFCEDANLCYRQNPNDENEIELRITSSLSEVVSGLPIQLTKDNKCKLKFDLNFYAANRSNNEEMGIKFLWYNNAGSLQYLGAYPGENGMSITIGKPTC